MGSSPFFSDEHAGFGKYTITVLERLIELALDAIIVRDPESRILFWNRGAQKLYGWTTQQALGHVTHVLLQTAFPASREALDGLLANGEHWEGELIQTCKDGAQIVVASRQVTLRDDESQPMAILEINRDITEDKQREHFLTEVGRALTSSLDYQETLTNIARLLVPQFADWFVVDLIDVNECFELV